MNDSGHRLSANERQIRGEARHPLVDVLERLEIGKLHHGEERLLERILDHGGRLHESARSTRR